MTNLFGVVLYDSTLGIKRLLSLDEKELRKLEGRLEEPKRARLSDYDGDSKIFSSSTRFKISDLTDGGIYSFLKEFADEDITTLDCLRGIDELEDGGFNPNLVFYYFKSPDQDDSSSKIQHENINIWVSKVKKQMITKNKLLLKFIKNTINTSGDVAMEVQEQVKSLILPVDSYLVEIIKNDDVYNLNVFKSNDLNEEFGLNSVIEDYAMKVVNEFSSEVKLLTKDKTVVDFKNLAAVENSIKSDERILKALSRFTGRSNRVINTISNIELKNALDKLQTHVKNKKAKFKAKNIPNFDIKSNKLNVDENQIAVFVALLDNKVVERILSGEVEIEFFE